MEELQKKLYLIACSDINTVLCVHAASPIMSHLYSVYHVSLHSLQMQSLLLSNALFGWKLLTTNRRQHFYIF